MQGQSVVIFGECVGAHSFTVRGEILSETPVEFNQLEDITGAIYSLGLLALYHYLCCSCIV